MAEEVKEGVVVDAVKAPRKRKQPEGVPFTTLTAKEAQKASIRARNLRKQVRSQIVTKLVTSLDFGDEMLRAIKSGDADRVALLEKAMRLVGLDYQQAQEALVAQMETKGGDGTSPTAIKFTLAKGRVDTEG